MWLLLVALYSVIIYNLNLVGLDFGPNKANSVPLIDTDAMLALSVARECFQMVTGRYPKLLK
jgi:hypothetical protein